MASKSVQGLFGGFATTFQNNTTIRIAGAIAITVALLAAACFSRLGNNLLNATHSLLKAAISFGISNGTTLMIAVGVCAFGLLALGVVVVIVRFKKTKSQDAASPVPIAPQLASPQLSSSLASSSAHLSDQRTDAMNQLRGLSGGAESRVLSGTTFESDDRVVVRGTLQTPVI